MYLVQVKFSIQEITSYMASHVLPDFYENMRLEKIGLDPKFINGCGNQPLVFTYSMPGRVEDFDMRPEEHAFPLIASCHPYFEPEKAQFIAYTPLWNWTTETVTINIEPKELDYEPTGEVVSTQDAYVSISRRHVFISFDVIQEFLIIQLAQLGLNLKDVQPLKWDGSRNALVLQAGTVTITWVISEPNAFVPLLYFLNLDKILASLKGRFRFSIEEAAPIPEPVKAMKIPLREKGETPYW